MHLLPLLLFIAGSLLCLVAGIMMIRKQGFFLPIAGALLLIAGIAALTALVATLFSFAYSF